MHDNKRLRSTARLLNTNTWQLVFLLLYPSHHLFVKSLAKDKCRYFKLTFSGQLLNRKVCVLACRWWIRKYLRHRPAHFQDFCSNKHIQRLVHIFCHIRPDQFKSSSTTLHKHRPGTWAPAPAMQLTDVNLSPHSPICLTVHQWLPVSSQYQPEHMQPAPEKGKLISSDDVSGLDFVQHLPCSSRPWIKGPIPIALIMLGSTCHAQHWHGGVLSMSAR